MRIIKRWKITHQIKNSRVYKLFKHSESAHEITVMFRMYNGIKRSACNIVLFKKSNVISFKSAIFYEIKRNRQSRKPATDNICFSIHSPQKQKTGGIISVKRDVAMLIVMVYRRYCVARSAKSCRQS